MGHVNVACQPSRLSKQECTALNTTVCSLHLHVNTAPPSPFVLRQISAQHSAPSQTPIRVPECVKAPLPATCMTWQPRRLRHHQEIGLHPVAEPWQHPSAAWPGQISEQTDTPQLKNVGVIFKSLKFACVGLNSTCTPLHLIRNVQLYSQPLACVRGPHLGFV